MSATHITRYINAPRANVYATLLDGEAVPKWKVPDGMTAEVHRWEAREGGTLRVSLTYDAPNSQGKSSSHTDTYHGQFTKLVPNECIVEVDEFETDKPELQGAMTITITLRDSGAGTELTATHENLPPGVPEEDNKTGWQMSLAKLAALCEAAEV
jgi:uncharacterized protein YndB with AHSA1/START domain